VLQVRLSYDYLLRNRRFHNYINTFQVFWGFVGLLVFIGIFSYIVTTRYIGRGGWVCVGVWWNRYVWGGYWD